MKHSTKISVKATKVNELVYVTIYEVKAKKENGDVTVIERFFSEKDAINCQEVSYDLGLYQTVYIMEQMVWAK